MYKSIIFIVIAAMIFAAESVYAQENDDGDEPVLEGALFVNDPDELNPLTTFQAVEDKINEEFGQGKREVTITGSWSCSNLPGVGCNLPRNLPGVDRNLAIFSPYIPENGRLIVSSYVAFMNGLDHVFLSARGAGILVLGSKATVHIEDGISILQGVCSIEVRESLQLILDSAKLLIASALTAINVSGEGNRVIINDGEITAGTIMSILGDARVTINGGKLEALGGTAIEISGVGSSLLINDGEVISGGDAISASQDAMLTINGGLVMGEHSAIRLSDFSALDLTGGSIDGMIEARDNSTLLLTGGELEDRSISILKDFLSDDEPTVYFIGDYEDKFIEDEFGFMGSGALRLDGVLFPVLTTDDDYYVYDPIEPYEGIVTAVVSLADDGFEVAQILSVNGGLSDGEYTINHDNTVSFEGTYHHQDVSLTVSATLASGRIAVEFETDVFELNLKSAATTTNSAELSPAAADNPLRAWIRAGALHVTGLTAGETISIYNASGALVHKSVANGAEMNVNMTTPGLYIIQSGGNSVRVVFE